MPDHDIQHLTRRGFLVPTGTGLAASQVSQASDQGHDEAGEERQVEFDNPQVGQPG